MLYCFHLSLYLRLWPQGGLFGGLGLGYWGYWPAGLVYWNRLPQEASTLSSLAGSDSWKDKWSPKPFALEQSSQASPANEQLSRYAWKQTTNTTTDTINTILLLQHIPLLLYYYYYNICPSYYYYYHNSYYYYYTTTITYTTTTILLLQHIPLLLYYYYNWYHYYYTTTTTNTILYYHYDWYH